MDGVIRTAERDPGRRTVTRGGRNCPSAAPEPPRVLQLSITFIERGDFIHFWPVYKSLNITETQLKALQSLLTVYNNTAASK